MLIGLALLCATLLAIAALAHLRLAAYTGSTRWLARTVLLSTGLLFGWVMAVAYTDTDGPEQILVFLSAAAVVHVPAAFVLQFKHWRGRDSREADGSKSHG